MNYGKIFAASAAFALGLSAARAEPAFSSFSYSGGTACSQWPTQYIGSVLQHATSLAGPWSDVAVGPTLNGANFQVCESLGAATQQYYRLVDNGGAQPVYSTNEVGFKNYSVANGTNVTYITNLFVNADNSVGHLFPTVPDSTTLFKWNGFSYNTTTLFAGAWDNPSLVLDPGGWFFFQTPISFVATLSGEVLQAPLILNQPSDQTVPQGTRAEFSVRAIGRAPLAYQWRKNGIPVSGATATNLVFPSAQPLDAAGYSVVITNIGGSVTSVVATLSLGSPSTAYTWNGGIGDWSNPGNWTPFGVPAALDGATINSGTVTVDTDVVIADLQFTGGEIDGPGSLTGKHLLSWSGGVLGTRLSIWDTALLNISGANPKVLDGSLENTGSIIWTGTGDLIVENDNATLHGMIFNELGGTFDIRNNQALIDSTAAGLATLNNAGTVQKLAGTGTNIISLRMVGDGLIDAEIGMLSFQGGGGLSGTFVAAAGSGIVFDAGDFSLINSSPASSGAGQVIFGALAQIHFDEPITGFIFNAGTLIGTNLLTGPMTWSGGTIAGRLSVASNAVLNISGPDSKILDSPLFNAGTVIWAGSGDLAVENDNATLLGAIFNQVGGLFEIRNDRALTDSNQSGFALLNNAGAVRKTALNGTTLISLRLNNSGLIEAQTGTISFESGGNPGGNFAAALGASILFNAGDFSLVSQSPSRSGLGQVIFGDSADILFSGPITNFIFNGGTLVGSNVVMGTMSWSGGALGGPLTVATGAVLNIEGPRPKFIDNPLYNLGIITWAGTGNLTVRDGGIYNEAGGLFDILNDQTIDDGTGFFSAFINNAGILRKSGGGGGPTSFSIILNNSGTVEALTGMIAFNEGGNLGGSFSADQNGTIVFNTGDFPLTGGSPASGGAGQIFFGPGANITFSGPITNFNFTGGVLSGTNLLTGRMTWSNGTIDGQLTVASSGFLNIAGPNPKVLPSPLINQGTILWTESGTILVQNDISTFHGAIFNQSGAVFEMRDDATLADAIGTGDAFFHNAGALRKTGGTGTSTFGVGLTNTGVLSLETGILGLGGDYFSAPGSRLEIQIGGLSPGTEYGQLQVPGTAALAGDLGIRLFNGFAPDSNSVFTVVTYGSRSGIYSALSGDGSLFQTQYNPGGLTLVPRQTPSIPIILSSLVDTNSTIGASVSFSITASSPLPLTYQWRLNGENIRGATNATLLISSVRLIDSGAYSVVVASSVGAVVSNPARLTVQVPRNAAGDNLSSRVALTGASGLAGGTNTFATREPGEPAHAGKPGGRSVWYSWTAPDSGIATFRTRGSTFDTLLAVYTGSTMSNLVSVASDEDGGGFLTSEVQFNAEAGIDYLIAIDGFGGASGDFVLGWDLELTAGTLPIILRQPQSLISFPGATVSFSVAASGSGLTYQWYLNSNPIPGATATNLIRSQLGNADIGVYTVKISNSSNRVIESAPVQLEFGPSPTSASEDKFQDLIANVGSGPTLQSGGAGRPRPSFNVSAGILGTQILNNFGATTEENEPAHAGVIGGASHWFVLIPQTNGLMEIDTIGSDIDTLLAVYTGKDLLSLHVVASDNNGAPDKVRSLVRFAASAGTNYLIAVDGVNGAQGTIQLNWVLGAVPGIAASPQVQSVRLGGNLTLTPSILGEPPPAAQWQLNGTNLVNATNAQWTIVNYQLAQAGKYSVILSNVLGLATNLVAELRVLELDGLKLDASGKVQFQLVAEPGKNYRIESTTNLFGGSWQTLWSGQATNGVVDVSDPAIGSGTNRYYRARSDP